MSIEKEDISELVKRYESLLGCNDYELACASVLLQTARKYLWPSSDLGCNCEKCCLGRAIDRWLRQRPKDAPTVAVSVVMPDLREGG